MNSLFTRIGKKALVVSSLAAGWLTFPSAVQAQTREWGNMCVSSEEMGFTDVATIQGLECLIANVLSVAISLIGLTGFVMLIIGSFNYLLSGSTSKGTDKAKSTITYAIIGLVVALSAFIIVNLISAFTGVSIIKNFSVPSSSTGL